MITDTNETNVLLRIYMLPDAPLPLLILTLVPDTATLSIRSRS